MAGGGDLEVGLHDVDTFYDELGPIREGEVEDIGDGVVPHITHDNVLEGIQRAMLSAMATMEGCLGCQELEAMEQLCKEGGDILGQLKVATFHAFCHQTAILQAITRDCSDTTIQRSIVMAQQLELEGGPSRAEFLLKHIRSMLWLVGLEADVRKYYKEAAVWLKETLIHGSGELRRGWCFHLQYALGNCWYQIAFHNCNGDPQMQKTFLNMALPKLAACSKEIAHQNTESGADNHQDVAWALIAFGKLAKGIIKHQEEQTSTFRKVREVYNEVAMYARMLGRGDFEHLLSQMCSGLRELEDHRRKLEGLTDDEEDEEEPDGAKSMAAGFKIFVEVLRFGVNKMANGNDPVLEAFDLLSHAFWWTKESMQSLAFIHLAFRFRMPEVEKYLEAKLGLCMLLLGMALIVLGDQKEGLRYLESAHNMFKSDQELNVSLHDVQKALALSYADGHAIEDHYKAGEMYDSASKTTEVLHTKLHMNMQAALQWVKVPEERVRALEKIQAILRTALQALPCEWELQAHLFLDAGMAHLEVGDTEEAIEHMEAGVCLCVVNDFAFTLQEKEFHAREIVIGLAQLLALYVHKGKLAAALNLHEAVYPILVTLKSITGEEKIWKDTSWRNWQQALDVFKEATGIGYHVNVNEIESSSQHSRDISKLMLNEDIGGGRAYLFAVADHFQNLAGTDVKKFNWAGAVSNMDILEEKLCQRGLLQNTAKVKLHINRASYLTRGGELSQALEEIQKAVEMMQDEEEHRDLLRQIYTTQSRIFWDLQDVNAAMASLDKAEQTCDEKQNLREIRMFRAHMFMKTGKLEMAEELVREIALSYANVQSTLGLESAWVHYLDKTAMREAFSNVEYLYRRKKDIITALVWAERGRARLYMHRADHLGTDEFDRSDQFAQSILWNTIELCSPGTVIIECTVLDNVLVLYALCVKGSKKSAKQSTGCFTREQSLDEFFKNPKTGEPCRGQGGKKLKDVVVKVREYIRNGEDGKAIHGLTILHTLLVQNLFNKYPDWLSSCTNIIFSPQEMLHLVPFMALYDGAAKKFLIEQKAISVIPSIRSLVHCFARQRKFENMFQALDGAFIAGNPEPMGLSLEPLPGATKEAQHVSRILGVEACKGDNITKKAVVKALSQNNVVLLATHGLIKKDNYPLGAIVLRRAATLDNNDQAKGLGNFTEARTSSASLEEQEVLTFEELARIDGGISAGLVVLSACSTGMGEVSREGLLCLGHALLQAGACSAIVNLWDVYDDSMGVLIADVFKELKSGTDVMHSVQKAVVDMLRGPEPRQIQDWSALTLLGSPSFQLPGYMQTSKVNFMHDSLGYFSGSRLLADDVGGSTMYMHAAIKSYEDQARQRQDEGDFETAIAVVNALEENLQKCGVVSPISKCKLYLWRGRYMNQLNGRSRETVKELQEAIDVLQDFDKAPELIALACLEQASAYVKLRDHDAANLVLDRARESVAKSNDNMLFYHSKVLGNFALSNDREFKIAVSFVQETQLEPVLGGESRWIPFVDDTKFKNPFSLYEMLCYRQGDVNKAVVWAEQGDINVSQDDVETDTAAAINMLEAVASCGPNTVIIKFSYHHQNLLMLYGLSSKISVCSRKYLKQFFNEENNCVMGTNLEDLVFCVRRHISQGEDEEAVVGLSILYKLLVEPILVHYKEFFDGYTKIIFAPQGILCKVPFAALYDASGGKFLVEQMAVGVIPSLHSLQCSFSRQSMFEDSLKQNSHSNAFVGGNSEPVALGLEQHLHIGETVKEVADILGVEACPGSNLTKEVFFEALSTYNIIMLATHAVSGNWELSYPYGAMILKGNTANHDEVLTCEEFAALAGKIRAGLVVILACSKGQEEAFNGEGLLGLGHATLEAGAITTVASLWHVGDNVLRPLVSSLFRELKQGRDVLCSMQKAMQDIVRSSEIRHWASLMVLGSPTLHISTQCAQTVHQAAPLPDSHTSNVAESSASSTSVTLDTVRVLCLQMLDAPAELGPLHALPQEVCNEVLQNLAKAEIENMKKVEQEGDSPMAETMACGNLGMVYGAKGEWSAARRWMVQSLSVAKENWEHVKDNLESDFLAQLALCISFLLRLHGTSSLNSDLDLVRFVLRCTNPTNKKLFDYIHQALAIWEC